MVYLPLQSASEAAKAPRSDRLDEGIPGPKSSWWRGAVAEEQHHKAWAGPVNRMALAHTFHIHCVSVCVRAEAKGNHSRRPRLGHTTLLASPRTNSVALIGCRFERALYGPSTRRSCNCVVLNGYHTLIFCIISIYFLIILSHNKNDQACAILFIHVIVVVRTTRTECTRAPLGAGSTPSSLCPPEPCRPRPPPPRPARRGAA